jgi:acetyl esterase/lipase
VALPSPRAAVTLSPWTDLSCDRESVTRNGSTDPILSPEFALWVAYQAVGKEDRAALKSPKVSAVFAPAEALAKLPPLYMSAGGAEILLDDTVDFARRATEAGANVKLAVRARSSCSYCTHARARTRTRAMAN